MYWHTGKASRLVVGYMRCSLTVPAEYGSHEHVFRYLGKIIVIQMKNVFSAVISRL